MRTATLARVFSALSGLPPLTSCRKNIIPSATHAAVRADPRLPPLVNSSPSGRLRRISTASTPGASQLIVVIPNSPSSVIKIGFGVAVKDGSVVAGQGAFTAVKQMFDWKVLAPSAVRFRMSKPEIAAGWSTDDSTPGFPITKFFRSRFPADPANRMIPVVLPTIMFSSMMLPVTVAPPGVPIPKLLPGVDNSFPLIRFARSRLRLAPPASHMPPHAAVTWLFRIAALFSNRLFDPLFTWNPEAQFVELVTSRTVELLLLFNWTP